MYPHFMFLAKTSSASEGGKELFQGKKREKREKTKLEKKKRETGKDTTMIMN
jgi:hypothetical protein